MRLRHHWLVVGAGFTGAVAARRLAETYDQTVLLIDRRPHLGGNAWDRLDEAGHRVHVYGPHIFHTNSQRLFAFLSRFTEWRPYFHRVRAHIDGRLVPAPFNLDSLALLFPTGMAERLGEKLIARFGFGARIGVEMLRQAQDDDDLRFLADYVFERLFLNYTRKQWGVEPETLDPSVMARVPIVVSRDDRYFTDRYQAMPRDGYAALFARLVDHPNIRVELSVGMSEVEPTLYDRMIYTGPLDDYFGASAGALPYRSLRFDHSVAETADGQEVGTVNYPNEFDFTRVTDFRHLTGQRGATTALVHEYPIPHEPGVTEPFYPVPSAESRALAAIYHEMAAGLAGKAWFAGRLGDYRYYNMDQAVGRALSLVDKELAPTILGRAA